MLTAVREDSAPSSRLPSKDSAPSSRRPSVQLPEKCEGSYEWRADQISLPPVPAETSEAAWKEHHEWAVRMWRRMDRNRSGAITRDELDCEEFRAVLRNVMAPADKHAGGGGASYGRARTNQEQALAFCLRKADTNHDGRLQFQEFRSLMWALRQEHLEKDTTNLIFALFDLDCDGFISDNEFRELCCFYMGHLPTFAEFSEHWSSLCRDKDRVSRERYSQWLKTTAAPIFKQRVSGAVANAEDGGVVESPAPGAKLGAAVAEASTSSIMSFTQASRRARRIKKNAEGWPLAPKKDVNDRPRWNQHFNTQINRNDRLPMLERDYFSKAQSMPQLNHFYATYSGFEQHQRALSTPDPPKKLRVLSTDTMEVFNAQRHEPGGSMKEHLQGAPRGDVALWEDNWQISKRFKTRLRASDRPLPPHAFFDASYEEIGPMARTSDGLPWSRKEGLPWHWAKEVGVCAQRATGKPCPACRLTKDMGKRQMNQTI